MSVTDTKRKRRNNKSTYQKRIIEELNKINNLGENDFQELMYVLSRVKDRVVYTPHTTVPVYNRWLNATIPIDKNIAHFMSLLWRLKIQTFNSCEDNVPRGYVWVEFGSSVDVERFLNIVFKNTKTHDIRDDELSMESDKSMDEIKNGMSVLDRAVRSYHYNPGAWKFDTITDIDDDYGDDDEDDDNEFVEGTGEIEVTVSVRFPFTDLDFVVEKLEDHINKMFPPKKVVSRHEKTSK